MVGLSPQTGQRGSLRSFISRNFICQASNNTNRFTRMSSAPRIILIVSFAWIAPIMPGKTPSTPPSAKDGTIDVRLAREHAGVVDKVARGKIVRAVNNDVVVLKQPHGIFAGQARLMRFDLDMRIAIAQT